MNKRAFTLVELLATITILAVIMVLVVPTALSMITDSKQKAYDLQVKKIISAAQEYTMDHKSDITELRTVESNYDVLLQTLADEGYLDLPILNPKTNENFDPDNTYVTIQKQSTGDYSYKLGKGSSVITLNGSNPDDVSCSATGNYTDPGAITNDPYTTETTTIYSTKTIALNDVGRHIIKYAYTSENEITYMKSRTVNIVNTNSPVITTAGDVSFVSLTVGSTFTAPVATATDTCDGTLTVTSTSTVVATTVGDYTVTYRATNSGNVTTTKVVTVRVLYSTPTTSFDSTIASVTYPYHLSLEAGTYTFKLTGGAGESVTLADYGTKLGGAGGTIIMSVVLTTASNVEIRKITNGSDTYRTSFHIYVNGVLYAASGGGGDANFWSHDSVGSYSPTVGGAGGTSTGGRNTTYEENGYGAIGATGGLSGAIVPGYDTDAQNTPGNNYPISTGGIGSSDANGGNGYAGGGGGVYSYKSWGIKRGVGGGGSSYVKTGIGITVTEDSQGTNAGQGYIQIVNTSIPSTLISYTGSYYTFNITTAGRYKIELFGAAGNNNGGSGGYTSGIITLTTSDVLYIYAGGKNGYNGGGLGYGGITSYNGGGATDVRLNSTSVNARIMVAGGGGGGSTSGTVGTYTGGAGGNLIGAVGSGYTYTSGDNHHVMWGSGGTQVIGGSTNIYTRSGTSYFDVVGLLFQGAAGLSNENDGVTNYSGAGGGGWYGGGNGEAVSFTDGTVRTGAGGGGSSYISGHTGSVAITSASDITPKSGCTDGTTDNTCSIHYSGRYFTDTVMISGANTDNGYARITYLGA